MKGTLNTSQFDHESAVRLKHRFQGIVYFINISTGLDLDSIIINLEKEPGVDKEMHYINEAGIKQRSKGRLSYSCFEIQDDKLVKKDTEI